MWVPRDPLRPARFHRRSTPKGAWGLPISRWKSTGLLSGLACTLLWNHPYSLTQVWFWKGMVKGNPLKGHNLAHKSGCPYFMGEQMAGGIALTCVQISVTQSSRLFSHIFPLFASGLHSGSFLWNYWPFTNSLLHSYFIQPFSQLSLNYVFISGKSTWIFYKYGQSFLKASCPLCIFKLFSLRMLNICLEFLSINANIQWCFASVCL